MIESPVPEVVKDCKGVDVISMKATISGLAVISAAAMFSQTFYAPKGKPAQYTAPHKPHTKLAEVKSSHAGQPRWRHTVVDDVHLNSVWVQAQPGDKEPQQLHPDTRTWWVVQEGEIRFTIEGQPKPIVGRKGSMVQVPMATIFSMETIGEKPSLRFETNIAHAKTLYVNQAEAPKIPGFNFVPGSFTRKDVMGVYLHNNKPHVHYDEVAEGVDSGKLKGTIRIVQDDRGTANFIYGRNSALPALDLKNKGHWHAEGAEYWLIMKGQIRYPIEEVGVVIANEGDVVYVPPSTYHAPRWWGEGASCRLAFNGFPYISHLFEAH